MNSLAMLSSILVALLIVVSTSTFAYAQAPTPTSTVRGRVSHPDPSTQLNATRVTLNSGLEFTTYTQVDGSFVFHRVPPGVHLLDVQSRQHHFSHVKIQLLEGSMDSPRCIEYYYPGSSKQVISHPLDLVAHAEYQYYETRKGFNLMSILKNPMLLMMLFSVGMMYFMPKMMEGLDPEQKELMQKQMAMQKDPTKMLTSMFQDIAGPAVEDAPQQVVSPERKPSAKMGGKTRRGKKD